MKNKERLETLTTRQRNIRTSENKKIYKVSHQVFDYQKQISHHQIVAIQKLQEFNQQYNLHLTISFDST